MKRFLIAACIIFLPLCAQASAAPYAASAGAAVLISADTNEILFEKNARTKLYPASTTKIMTLIVALENGDPEEIVSVGADAAKTGGSSLELRAGEQMRLLDLMYGLMLVSGNDAAVAIADHVAGSAAAFAEKMNRKAKEIGAQSTHFTNPNGLPDAGHYTSAYDLSQIAKYGYQYPLFRDIVGAKRMMVGWHGSPRVSALKNTNRLLGAYPGCDGVKTGYTRAAGRCLVASAERGGARLIAVVMNSDNRWEEAAALLDYGFAAEEARRSQAKRAAD